jgi:septal ring factor EnvC (AmiA/AmiB activator)
MPIVRPMPPRLRPPRARVLICAVLAIAAAAGVAQADRRGETEAQLGKVRARIEAIRTQITEDLERRDRLAAELRRTELSIQQAQNELARLRSDRQAAQRRLAELRNERRAADARIAAERDALAGELRAAYLNGRHERLKLLLAQQDPQVLGRMMVYYRYFGDARAERIAAIDAQLNELERLSSEIDREANELAQLEAAQAAEVQKLASAREDRRGAVAALEQQIGSRKDEIARLEKDAAALDALLAELRRAAEDFPILAEQPFARTQGRLPWPVKGKVTARFGELRAGGPLRWHGIVISAERGAEVRAPHFGRVIYADWLPGMGLLIVLDHGDGYMTLYGHNDRLFRAVGDRVAPGDVIATVGDSGGNARAGLYIEVRKGKTPLDPLKWLRKA